MNEREIVDLLYSTVGVGFLLAPLVLVTVGGAVGLIDATLDGDRPATYGHALRLSIAAAAWVWAGPMVARGGWWTPDGRMANVGALALLVVLAGVVLRAASRAATFLIERWEDRAFRYDFGEPDEADGLFGSSAEEFSAREEWLLSRLLDAHEELERLEEGRGGPLAAAKRILLRRRVRKDQRRLERLREESAWTVS